MAQSVKREITVLGAGVAGLTVAIALARHGHSVIVLERAEEIREVGAGLQISANGKRVLDALGLDADAAGRATLSQAVVLRDHQDGKELARLSLSHDLGMRLMHRADLIELLAENARALGVQIRLLHHVDHIEIAETGKPSLRLKTGGVLRPEVLIGADGLRSLARRAVLGKGASDPSFTGQVAWRTLVPGRKDDPAEATVYMGPRKHLVSYPLRGGKLRNIVAVEERRGWTEEGWNHPDDPTRVQRAFSGFAPEVRGWLGDAREVYLWGLFRYEVPKKWFRGSVVMMGDAVHPTLPFLAQGANMALEDAWVLAECITRFSDLEAGFARYQELRYDRTRKIVGAADTNAWVYHLSPGLTRSVVHMGLKLGNRFAPDQALKRFDWLYDEDVTATPV